MYTAIGHMIEYNFTRANKFNYHIMFLFQRINVF